VTRDVEARVAAPWAAAWVDLLGDVRGARTLVAEWAPGCAASVLVERGAVVSSDARDGPFDLVVLDGTPGRVTSSVAGALRPGGRVALVVDNARSPLRLLDRAYGRPAGPAVGSLARVRRRLAAAGLPARQSFGLLRSSVAPVTGFDLDAPAAAAAVLDAAATRIGGRRLPALSLLRAAVVRGSGAALVPAWLVVAGPATDGTRLELPVTGRIGYEDSEQVKVVRGEPPTVLEKRYLHPVEADNEAAALEALAAAGVGFVPRLLGRDGPLRASQTWMPGRALNVGRLRRSELARWLLRAAESLAEIQRRTARGGEVLVHGDFWLGNVLVAGDDVVAVVDWTEARWGDPAVDAAHLVSTLVGSGALAPADADALRPRIREVLARA
jgi:Phosphotransferase enzyme family